MEKTREVLYKRLCGADKILIQDYSNYCPYKAANGGQYLDETEYTKIDDDRYEALHYTSADFDFCPIYGQYQSCDNCPDYDDIKGCIAEPRIVSITDIIDSIEHNLKESNIQVYAWFDDDKELIVTCDHHYPGYCSICNDEYESCSYIVGKDE